MSSNRNRSRFQTVTFRLTALHLALFTVVSLGLLAMAHAHLHSILIERADEDLAEDLRELEAVYVARGIPALQAEFDRETQSTGAGDVFLALVAPGGEVLASSDPAPWSGILIPPEAAFQTVRRAGRDVADRVACRKLDGGNMLCTGYALAEEGELMEIFRGVLAAAMLGMIASGGIMGWLLSRRAMSGVERVTRTAVRIGRDRLGERVSIGHEGREIEDLATAFNSMLDRIDTLVADLREVTDNLAHDLRSPMTRLRGAAETTLLSDAKIDDYRELAATVVEETDALIALLNTMLDIAETDSGMAKFSMEPVNVGRLIAETHELFQPAAEDSGIRLECAPAPEGLAIRGDLARLQRVMANLLDNAIKYTPRGGTIRVSAAKARDRAVISVADTGAGIDARDVPRIFDRFYRADASRSHEGSGLGLSLVQSIVRAHRGEIAVESAPGKGSTFTVSLPLAGSS